MLCFSITASCLLKNDCNWVKDADLEDNIGKKRDEKDESSYMYLHRQVGMQVSSCSETVNNPYTYTCDDLYMASPLEKKQRTGSVNTTQNMDCPVLCYGSCWTMSSY